MSNLQTRMSPVFTLKCIIIMINFISSRYCSHVNEQLLCLVVLSDRRPGPHPHPPAVRPQQADLQRLWGAAGGSRHRTQVGLSCACHLLAHYIATIS